MKEHVIILSEIKRYNHFYSFRLIKYKSFIFGPARSPSFGWEGLASGGEDPSGSGRAARKPSGGGGVLFFWEGMGLGINMSVLVRSDLH